MFIVILTYRLYFHISLHWHSSHWGRGVLETSGNILGTLQALDHFSPMYPPITSGVHLECNLNMFLACIHQITFKMLSKIFPKCSQHMFRNDVPMCPTCCSLVCHVLSMFSKRVACSHNIPTGHMAGSFLEYQWQPC